MLKLLICTSYGVTAYNERTRSDLQNGIDPVMNAGDYLSFTPGDLASNAAESIFERTITQAEFESWHPSLLNAKAQGSAPFLQEMRNFYRQLFASSEYIQRQRTDDEFVADVFESHLWREPTTFELAHWKNYLVSLGGGLINPEEPDLGGITRESSSTSNTINPVLQRQAFLQYFQNMPQFVSTIESVIDATYLEPVYEN